MNTPLRTLLHGAFLLAVAALWQPTAAQTPWYTYSPPGGTVSDFFVLGNTQTRHNQTLYAPGLFGLMPDSFNISTIYLRYGQNTAGQGNTRLDSLTLRLGQSDSTRLSMTGTTVLFEPMRNLTVVRFDSSLAIPEGASGTWLAFPLQQPFGFNSHRSLVLDIQFKSSSNAFFNTMGTVRVNERIRIGARRFTDTVGGLSEVAPHLGLDMMVVGKRPSLKASRLIVGPNPSAGSIFIQADAVLMGKPYHVVDALGRTIRQGSLQERTGVKGLRKGCYRLLAEGASRTIVVE